MEWCYPYLMYGFCGSVTLISIKSSQTSAKARFLGYSRSRQGDNIGHQSQQPVLTEGRRVGWHTHHSHSWLPLSEEPSQISVNMLSQISAILGGLEGHILRRKRKIYESVTSSIQNDLKPCYEGGPQGGTSSSQFSGIPFPINFLLCWQLSKNPSLQPEFLYCS